MIKKIISILTVFIMAMAMFSGCMGNDNNNTGTNNLTGSNTSTENTEKLSVNPIDLQKAPKAIQSLAKKSQGKLTYFAAENDGKFYVILSSNDKTTYGISQAELMKTGDASYVAISILEKNSENSNGVSVYQIKTSKMPNGILFQSAANKAVQGTQTSKNNNVADNIVDQTKDIANNAKDALDNAANKANATNNKDTKAAQSQIVIFGPTQNSINNSSPIKVTGKVKSVSKVDKVYIVILDNDKNIFGQSESMVSDLSSQFSSKVKYTIPNNIPKDANGYTDAIIKVYSKKAGVEDYISTYKVKIK